MWRINFQLNFSRKEAEKIMVYDGAFIAEAFPAHFPLSVTIRETAKHSAMVGERKGIIWLNFAEWRFKNTFSSFCFILFY